MKDLKKWICEHGLIEIVQLAEEQGHEVLFTPPYHSDFQPIELVWEIMKGGVGRKYSSSTTLADICCRLNAEFASLQTTKGKKLIHQCTQHAHRIIETIFHELSQGEESESESEFETMTDMELRGTSYGRSG